MDLPRLLERVPDYREFFTLEELRGRIRTLCREFPGLARLETVGESSEGRPIELLTIGHGRRPVLLVGVPHPNEPIGTLTIDAFTRLLCEDDALRIALDCTVYVVPVADPDGFALNEGWFKGAFSPARYALNYYRPPHCEQVEWSFPVDYKTLRFSTPTRETQAVMRVMERVRPEVFYSLHNAGFCGVYYYVTRQMPELVESFHQLVASQGLPLHRGEPEVPYLTTLAPAVYRLFGIQDTYEYMARTLGEDPAPLIEAGTGSDDWLATRCDAFSLVCELPYYTAPALQDETPTDRRRGDVVCEGVERAARLHAEVAAAFERVRAAAPDHRLTRSVSEYVKKTPKRLAAQRAEAATAEYDRPATRAETMDAVTCTPFYHLVYLGEMFRVAELVGDASLATSLRDRVTRLAEDLARESGLVVLPLAPLVRVQVGSGLLTIEATAAARAAG